MEKTAKEYKDEMKIMIAETKIEFFKEQRDQLRFLIGVLFAVGSSILAYLKFFT